MKVKIELEEYCYNCADGCCTVYGRVTKVNGKELDLHNQDSKTMIQQILIELGYEVEITETYTE